jgi:4-carboxymuconolactone decarboxylase
VKQVPDRSRHLFVGDARPQSRTTIERNETMSEQTMGTPVLDLLATMTMASLEASTLDNEALVLVRIAALVAVDAPPASYMLNLVAADDAGVDAERVAAVLAAVAPIVGTAKVVSAAGKIARALGLASEFADVDDAAAS